MEKQGALVAPGKTIEIRALKSGGQVYRQWRANVESRLPDGIVTVNRVGSRVAERRGGWRMKHAIRTVFWFDRAYNLIEAYEADGRLKQVYIHIASPAEVARGCLEYIDYELDVVKRRGEGVCMRDEAEFEAAIEKYGYSSDLQSACWAAVEEAKTVAANWKAGGPPRPFRRGRI